MSWNWSNFKANFRAKSKKDSSQNEKNEFESWDVFGFEKNRRIQVVPPGYILIRVGFFFRSIYLNDYKPIFPCNVNKLLREGNKIVLTFEGDWGDGAIVCCGDLTIKNFASIKLYSISDNRVFYNVRFADQNISLEMIDYMYQNILLFHRNDGYGNDALPFSVIKEDGNDVFQFEKIDKFTIDIQRCNQMQRLYKILNQLIEIYSGLYQFTLESYGDIISEKGLSGGGYLLKTEECQMSITEYCRLKDFTNWMRFEIDDEQNYKIIIARLKEFGRNLFV